MPQEKEDIRIHALLVDDDVRLQTNVRDFLEPYGCRITSRTDGRNIEAALEEVRPDIILLDVMLPGDDGFAVLQRLRAVSRIPVLMLTARGHDADRIVGLEMGADDYLPKPFNPRELLARIKAVLRRTSPHGTPPEQMPDMLSAGQIRLDLKRQKLCCADDCIDLTITEFRIIRTFMSRPDSILSRDEIQTLSFGENYHCSDRNIDVYISRARNTLRKLCGESPIRTVWGSGYCWVKDEGGEQG
ncbi:response regulator [Desulfovibrio sp. OttesenSCG-928-C06]|nr:response regulator [Desulfovibrio sp. OttesenSCG-928-C06]